VVVEHYIALYNSVADVGARIGPLIFGIAMAVMVAIFTALAIMFYHTRPPDADEGQVVNDSTPYNRQSTSFTGTGKLYFRSKRKMLLSRSAFVSTESIVNGTATTAQRLFVFGVSAVFFCMSLMMIGAGLMLLKKDWTSVLFCVSGMAFFPYYVLVVLRDVRRVKKKQADRALSRRKHSAGPAASDDPAS
jgi:hypothetical protein